MIYIGIDPGLDGCLAALSDDGKVVFHDMATIKTDTGKRRYNVAWLVGVLDDYQMEPCMAGLEVFTGFPGMGSKLRCAMCNQPRGLAGTSVSALAQGRGIGIWEGALAMAKISTRMVSPQAWRSRLLRDTDKSKDSSRLVAMRLFPQIASQLQLKKHHGRADALLIAEYVASEYRNEVKFDGKGSPAPILVQQANPGQGNR